MVYSQNIDTSAINNLFSSAYEKDIFSGTVLIEDNDEIVFQKSYGKANWENERNNNNSTKYNIGSIGKLFTQILIMQLYQEGKLSLKDNLDKFFTGFPSGDKITIKQMLIMSSGLGDYFRIKDFRDNPYKYKGVLDLVNLIKEQRLLFEPGTGNEYSNSGYAVLGGIIEKITGKSYLTNLKERIFIPLGMKNSDFIYLDEQRNDIAVGHLISASGKKTNNLMNITVPTPAGGAYSTTEDLLKIAESIIGNNKLLNDKYKAIWGNRFEEDSLKSWTEMKASQKYGYGIAGGSPGWNSILTWRDGGKAKIILLSNYDQGAENILPYLKDILSNKKPKPLQTPLNRFIYSKFKELPNLQSDELSTLIKENNYELESDMLLNRIGYDLINEKMIVEAIEVFKLNTSLYPNIPNVWDSLAEAYLLNGDKEKAIQNYKKASELDPDNPRIKKSIKDIE